MRTYGDPCGIARALDAVGERWGLLVVRELVLGPKRFTDLQRGLPGVSTDILSGRLRQLEAAGVVRRATLPPPAAAKVYELTDRGHELEPVLQALGRWGRAQPMPEGGRELGSDAFLVALQTLWRGGPDATVGLRLGEETFTARVRGGALELRRGAAEDPDATIAGDVATLREVLWRGAPADGLEISGDRRVARRFLSAFPQD
jgi:DNA-binding HxlR family transcriptional regulator